MIKVDKSPSSHVEAEWLQESHSAVTLQEKVQRRIASRKTQRKQSGTIEDEEEQMHTNMARWNTNENSAQPMRQHGHVYKTRKEGKKERRKEGKKERRKEGKKERR